MKIICLLFKYSSLAVRKDMTHGLTLSVKQRHWR